MDGFKKGNRHTVEFIHGVSFKTMPDEVVEQAKICLLDLIGACLAGRKARGDYNESPLSRNELKDKFLNITKGIIEHDAAGNLIELVRDFENRRTIDLIPYLA